MAEFPALPLFTDAYLADTHPSLTLEEHGCYLLLLQISWRQPTCTLPDDDAFLARALALHGNRWTRLRKQVLERFFQRNSEGRWYQKRLIKEWKYVHRKRKVRISDDGVVLPTPEESGVENARKTPGKVSETSRKSPGNDIQNADKATAYDQSPTPTPTPIEDSPLSANADISPTTPEPEPPSVAPDGAAAPAKAVAVRDRSPPAGEFERWWAEVPRRVGKDAARRKFTAVVKAGQVTVDELVAGIRRYAQHIRTNAIEPQYVAHPATWLHQGRWQDELTDHRHGRRADPYVSPAAEIITEHLQRLAGLPDERDFAAEGGYSGEPGGKIVALPRRA